MEERLAILKVLLTVRHDLHELSTGQAGRACNTIDAERRLGAERADPSFFVRRVCVRSSHAAAAVARLSVAGTEEATSVVNLPTFRSEDWECALLVSPRGPAC